jgi:hypothetical protein
VKFTSLLANLVIFHNTLDIADVVRQLQAEGWEIDPLDLAGIAPEDYDTRLDVDFTTLEDERAPAA